MTLDFILFIIIVLVIGGFGAIRKLKEALESQVDSGEDARVEYEATPAEIQEFLRSIATGQKAQANAQAPPDAAPQQARPQAAPQQRRPPGAQQRAAQPAGGGRSFWDALEDSSRPAVDLQPQRPTAARTQRPKRRHRRQEPAAKSRKPSRKAPEAPAPEKRKAAAGLTPLALKGMDLKQAVAWSEILGPPVSLRGRGRRK